MEQGTDLGGGAGRYTKSCVVLGAGAYATGTENVVAEAGSIIGSQFGCQDGVGAIGAAVEDTT